MTKQYNTVVISVTFLYFELSVSAFSGLLVAHVVWSSLCRCPVVFLAQWVLNLGGLPGEARSGLCIVSSIGGYRVISTSGLLTQYLVFVMGCHMLLAGGGEV